MNFSLFILAVDWVEIIGFVVVVVFYLMGHLLSSINKNAAPPKQGFPKPRGAAAPPQPPRTIEEKLRNEVEEFLRRVQGDEPLPLEPQRPVIVMPKAPMAVTVDEPPSRVSVQEHVARHISTADVAQHAAMLGHDIDQADERMQAHIQTKFQNQLGSLEPKAEVPASRPRQNTPAAQIAQLLRNPAGMRQAVVLAEILRRPEI